MACSPEAEPAGERAGDESAPVFRSGAVEVTGAVVARPVLGERTALYFDLANAGQGPDTLLGVDAEGLGQASLHRTESVDGVSRMRPVEAVEIPPAGRVELRPGGLHVMIEGMVTPLSEGDTVFVTVRLARAGAIPVGAVVVPYADLLETLDSGR